MKAQLNPAQLLQWYADVGVDEAMLDSPVDRTRIVEKIEAAAPAIIIPIAQKQDAPAPLIGAIEALGAAHALAAEAKTVDELKTALESFQGLALKRTATQIVFAGGNPAAKIMIVGESPSADEDRTGSPFGGKSGQLLDKMLAAIGLDREKDTYLTYMINWYPPGSRAPSETEVALSLPFVQRHIELINPAVLICVGGLVTKSLLQSSQAMMRLRGKWLGYKSGGLRQPIPSLVFVHPSYLLASPAQKPQAWAELLMLKAKLKELGVI